jgi:hypothetical protein
MKTTIENEKIYGLNGLAEFLGISLPSAARLQRMRKFPTYKPGLKRYVFIASEVLEGIKEK